MEYLSGDRCAFCTNLVHLTEDPHTIGTSDTCGIDPMTYQGLVIANAECAVCLAKYVVVKDESKFGMMFRFSASTTPADHDYPEFKTTPRGDRGAPWDKCMLCDRPLLRQTDGPRCGRGSCEGDTLGRIVWLVDRDQVGAASALRDSASLSGFTLSIPTTSFPARAAWVAAIERLDAYDQPSPQPLGQPKDTSTPSSSTDTAPVSSVPTGDADFDRMIARCVEILSVKGRDYTIGDDNRLHNFDTCAEFTGQTPYTVLGVYLYKHVAAVFAYLKSGGQNEAEPIDGRIADVINYMLLLYKMVERHRRTRQSISDINDKLAPIVDAFNQLAGDASPVLAHSRDCGTKYRGCAPNCPKDKAETECLNKLDADDDYKDAP